MNGTMNDKKMFSNQSSSTRTNVYVQFARMKLSLDDAQFLILYVFIEYLSC